MNQPTIIKFFYFPEKGVRWTVLACVERGWVKILDDDANQIFYWSGLSPMEVKYLVMNYKQNVYRGFTSNV